MKRFRIVGGLAAAAVLALGVTAPAAQAAAKKKVEVLAHVNPGVGANADVFAHRGHAYLGSWIGNGCLSSGVRIYDLKKPRSPRQSTSIMWCLSW